MPKLRSLSELLLTIFHLLLDSLRLIGASLQPRCRLAAENLFLRKQLALYLERQVKPRRAKAAARLTLVLLSKLFVWREVLTVVKPETFIRWHRQGVRLLWRWKSKPRGRPRIPAELQKLIAEMADDNPTWGEERIAAELRLKLGIRISPRTVRRYLPPDSGPRRGASSQRWMTFVRNHTQGILACDFFVSVRPAFGCCTSSWLWKWERAGSLTSTSPVIPPQTGRCASFERWSRGRNRADSSFATATAFTRRSSTRF